MRISVKTVLTLGALVAMALPPVIFTWVALFAGLGIGESLSALVAQYSAPRQNLLVCGVVGLLPLGLLAAVLWLLNRLAPGNQHRPALALGGLAPILAVLAWVNMEFWPTFLPSRTYPGFPHGLEFVIGPIFFAPVGMAVGLLVLWLATRKTG